MSELSKEKEKKLKEKKINCLNEIDNLKKEIHLAKFNIKNLENEKNNNINIINKLKIENNNLKTFSKKLLGHQKNDKNFFNKINNENVKNYKNNILDLKSEIESLKEVLIKQNDSILEIKNNIKNKENLINDTESKIKNNYNLSIKLNKDFNNYNNQILYLENKNKFKDNNNENLYENLENQIDFGKNELIEKNELIKKLKTKNIYLENQLKKFKTKNIILKNDYLFYNNKIKNLKIKSNFDTLKEEINNSRNAISDRKKNKVTKLFNSENLYSKNKFINNNNIFNHNKNKDLINIKNNYYKKILTINTKNVLPKTLINKHHINKEVKENNNKNDLYTTDDLINHNLEYPIIESYDILKNDNNLINIDSNEEYLYDKEFDIKQLNQYVEKILEI